MIVFENSYYRLVSYDKGKLYNAYLFIKHDPENVYFYTNRIEPIDIILNDLDNKLNELSLEDIILLTKLKSQL